MWLCTWDAIRCKIGVNYWYRFWLDIRRWGNGHGVMSIDGASSSESNVSRPNERNSAFNCRPRSDVISDMLTIPDCRLSSTCLVSWNSGTLKRFIFVIVLNLKTQRRRCFFKFLYDLTTKPFLSRVYRGIALHDIEQSARVWRIDVKRHNVKPQSAAVIQSHG